MIFAGRISCWKALKIAGVDRPQFITIISPHSATLRLHTIIPPWIIVISVMVDRMQIVFAVEPGEGNGSMGAAVLHSLLGIMVNPSALQSLMC